ncbi:unnamed protein product [Rotaria sordida]|uniref:Uncharacterized protein n=1 Tax=Rotaria sordida TaxID=392033 RepID=A0A814KY76_9BILA|nr:unnamed protein product [Rotaria sordida]
MQSFKSKFYYLVFLFSVLDNNRSSLSQYDNQAFEHDIPKINIQPADDSVSIHSPLHMPQTTENRDGYRIQARNVWVESETNNDPLRRNDYRDEYLTAKQSVLNTKNIISSIHNELQHITSRSSGDYHA